MEKKGLKLELLRGTHELPLNVLFTKGLLLKYCSCRREKYKKCFFWTEHVDAFCRNQCFDTSVIKNSSFHGWISSLSTIYTCLQKVLPSLTFADRFWVLQTKLVPNSIGYSINSHTHTHTHNH